MRGPVSSQTSDSALVQSLNVCFMFIVNSYGHAGMLSYSNHTFPRQA